VCVCMCVCVCVSVVCECVRESVRVCVVIYVSVFGCEVEMYKILYGVATISRLLKIIGLFCSK